MRFEKKKVPAPKDLLARMMAYTAYAVIVLFAAIVTHHYFAPNEATACEVRPERTRIAAAGR